MLTYAQDWELGHSPVTTGRAPWLPSVFIQAVHAASAAMRSARQHAQQRAYATVTGREKIGGVRS